MQHTDLYGSIQKANVNNNFYIFIKFSVSGRDKHLI